MSDSPVYAAYAAKLEEAEAELGADMIPIIGFLTTTLYANDLDRARTPLPDIPVEKRQRVFAYADALTSILRNAEPPSMRNL
jgi:hypothetical protein